MDLLRLRATDAATDEPAPARIMRGRRESRWMWLVFRNCAASPAALKLYSSTTSFAAVRTAHDCTLSVARARL